MIQTQFYKSSIYPAHSQYEVDKFEGNRRLLVLADHLDSIPAEKEKHFYLGSWSSGYYTPGDPQSFFHTCGTTACAWGIAALIPEFVALGVKTNLTASPTWGPFYGFNAATRFFSLQIHEAQFLFSFVGYKQETKVTVRGVGPKDVSRHIREFVDLRKFK